MYRTISIKHSTWLLILITHNLPPQMCMKLACTMISLLIHGPSSFDKDIDLYLSPIIEELKELWIVGVDTCDN